MQGLPQLVDRCADDFISSFRHDWVSDESGPEYGHQYGEAILQNLDAFETSFRAEVRRRIATRLRQRNACVPISKLPPELLQLIFHFNLVTSSGSRAYKYVRKLVTLRSVSWGWRALLDRSPFLWGHIASSDHPEFISKALENSKEAPLHLRYASKWRGESQPAFLDKVFPHLHRWESISIHNPTHNVLTNYFTSRAPLLKRMVLSTSREWEWLDPVSLFSRLWTSLEELRISRRGDIDWRGIQFGRRLRVVDLYSCGMLEASLIFRVILENQHLEILRLTWITFTSSTPLTHSNTPIVLSHLKDLTLSGLTFADPSNVGNHPRDPAFHILRHIRFPSCTEFTVSALIESDSAIDPEELRSLLPSPLDFLAHPSPSDPQASQPAMGYLSADFSDHDLTLRVDRGPGYELEYRVTLECASRSITRSWLQSALGDRPGVTLQEFSLHIRIKEHSHLDELLAFQDSEAVTLLSFGIDGGPLGEEIEARILQLLATPYTLASGTTKMPFPRLSTVQMYGWKVQGKAVLEMAQKRFLTPGVDVHRPDVIVVRYGDDEKAEFRLHTGWNPSGVGWIHSVKAVRFGATNLWPYFPGRPRSPESRWPPSDENEDEDMDFTGGDESDWE